MITFAKEHNFKIKLHYLNFSNKIRFKIIQKRNQKKDETFRSVVNKEGFDFMESWFEKPTKKELKNALIVEEK